MTGAAVGAQGAPGRTLFRVLDRAIVDAGRYALGVSAFVVLVLALAGAADVLLTNLFKTPLPSLIEFSGAGHVLVVFLVQAAVQARNAQIRIDIVTERMRPPTRRGAELVTLVVGAAFFALITVSAWDMTGASFRIGETNVGLVAFPIWLVKGALALGATLATLEFTRQIVWWCLPRAVRATADAPASARIDTAARP